MSESGRCFAFCCTVEANAHLMLLRGGTKGEFGFILLDLDGWLSNKHGEDLILKLELAVAILKTTNVIKLTYHYSCQKDPLHDLQCVSQLARKKILQWYLGPQQYRGSCSRSK